MKTKLFKGNSLVLLLTAAGFAIGYYIYLDVYTKNKEADIIATKSSILAQMADNLEQKIGSFKKNAEWTYDSFKKEYQKKNIFDKEDVIRRLAQTSNPLMKYKWIKKKKDSDTLDFQMSADKSGILFAFSDIAFSDSIGVLNLSFSLGDLLAGITNKSIFQEYLVVDNNGEVIFSSLPGNPVISQASAKDTNTVNGNKEDKASIIEIVKHIEDAYWLEHAVIKGVSTFEVMISNQNYRMFTTQLQFEDFKWQFCGLVESEMINAAKRGMAPGLVVIIFMILSITILGLPFIQLKTISPTETLKQGAMINAAISVFLGACFIFIFIFFQGNVYWRKKQNEYRLISFAEEVEKKFVDEIHQAWQQLQVFDDSLKADIDRKPSKEKFVFDKDRILVTEPDLHYPYFDYVFWMPKSGQNRGQQVVRYTTFARLGEPSNLVHRDYFNKADEWILPPRAADDDSSHDHRFRMESLVSVSSGIAKAAISRLSSFPDTVVVSLPDTVVAMTGQFHSVIETLVPAGFKFCIIDSNGKVWFHSEKGRNNNENLPDVSKQNKYLRAAMYAGASDIIQLNYYDEPHRAFIQPVSNLPLFIVTMYDKQFEYSYQRQVLMLTLLLFSAMVIFMVIQVFVLVFLDNLIKQPGNKSMLFDFIRMRPENSMVYRYMSAILFLTVAIFFIFTDGKNVLNPLIFSIISMAYLFPYLNYAVNDFSFHSLNRNLYAGFNIVLIVLINLSAIKLLDDNNVNLINFQLFVLLFIYAGYIIIQNINHKKSSNPQNNYLFFLLMLLLAFGIAPSIRNFEAALNHELMVEKRHAQFELANNYLERNIRIKNYYKPFPQDDSTANLYKKRIRQGIYTEAISSSFVSDSLNIPNSDKGYHRADSLVNRFKPLSDRLSVEGKYLANYHFPDRNKWSMHNESLVYRFVSDSEHYNFERLDTLKIQTSVSRPRLFNPWFDEKTSRNSSTQFFVIGFFWIMVLLALSGVYFLIRYSVRNMFGFSVTEKYNKTDFWDDLQIRLEKTRDLPVLIIDSPFGSFVQASKTAPNQNITFRNCDKDGFQLIVSKSKENGGEKYDILKEAFSNYQKADAFEEQLKEINKRIRKKRKVLLISSIPLHAVEAFITQKLNTEAEKGKWEQISHDYRQIIALTSVLHLPQKTEPLKETSNCGPVENCDNMVKEIAKDKDKYFECFICRELRYSNYLYGYYDEMKSFYKNLQKEQLPDSIVEERITLKIKEIANQYYDYLLTACSPPEKFVLSDLANDQFVNVKNKVIIHQLLKKGLLVIEDHSVRFMNESFRRFVEQKITKQEKEKLKQSLGVTGTGWKGYKLFLILVVVGVIIFLFLANKDIFENLSRLFAVATGGIVLLTNITGFISRGSGG